MKGKKKKIISLFLSAAFLSSLSLSYTVNAATESSSKGNFKSELFEKSIKKFSEQDILKNIQDKYGKGGEFDDNQPASNSNENSIIRVIVQLKDNPVLQNSNIKSSAKSGMAGIKKFIEDNASYASKLDNAQKAVIAQAKKLNGAVIRNTYKYTANGFSMDIKKSEVDKLKKLSGVKSVKDANRYKPDMTYAKNLTQATEAWQSFGVKGEGTVVAVVDSGIDVTHKDMKVSDPGKDKLNKNNVILEGDPGKFYTDKVPYAYNFADKNNDILDTNSLTGMHGMHVAGIIGANGDQSQVDNLQAIQGVAPECQILAMRVFSNKDGEQYAYSDDIAAAIESSVLHGADVINMSLGSSAGFQDEDDIEQVAIENAANQGVVVVVSAGNSYYSSYPYKTAGLIDTGIVGSPGVAKDAIQVASYENTNITTNTFSYTSSSANGAAPYFTSDVNPIGVLNGQYEIVDCGLGTKDDFAGKDLTGKIALIKRGSISFVDKKLNAQEAKAAGAIIYNKDGDDSYINMATDPQITIPAVFISNTDGTKLKNATGVKVVFDGKVSSVDNINKNQMSDFTSYGPTPNLDFKPEISAPGGNIYSTVNGNKYEVMSGTSMAAPHTSGAEALIVEALKQQNPNLSGHDLVELAKTTTINTASMKLDGNGLPFSPRRQGSGLLQIKNAIANKVTVTDDAGNAAVPLKEMDDTNTFRLNLTNYDSTAVTYKLSNPYGVLTDVPEPTGTMCQDMAIAGATVEFNADTITVPANGKAEVYATVKIPSSFKTEQFAEGFIKLASQTDGTPDLSVPFMGFYGEWSKPDIIDKPMWDKNSIFGATTLFSEEADGYYYLGEDETGAVIPEKLAISPNGDGYFDNAIPYLSFLRNAKEFNIAVVDSKGKIVRNVVSDGMITKNIPNDKDSGVAQMSEKWLWDGKINGSDGSLVAAPEGQYYLRISSKIDYEKADLQDVEMPVKVDVTAPTVKITSSAVSHKTKYVVTWNFSDNYSGTGSQGVFINGVLPEGQVITHNSDGSYSCEVTLDKGTNGGNNINHIVVAAFDGASNYSDASIDVNYIPFNIAYSNVTNGMKVNSNELTVNGTVNYNIKALKFNNSAATINSDLTFSAPVSLSGITNDIHVQAIDIDDSVLYDDYVRVYCDTTAPTVNLSLPQLVDGKIYTNKDTVNLKGDVWDDTFGYKFYINNEEKLSVNLDNPEGENGTKRGFDYDVPVTNASKIQLKAVDVVGNQYLQEIEVLVDKNAPTITVTGVEDGKSYKTDVTPVISADKGTLTKKLDGSDYDNASITAEGTHKLEVTAVDLYGNVSKLEINFIIDKTAPVITIEGVENGKYYAKDVQPKVSSNEGALSLNLDGKTYDGGIIREEGNHTLKAVAVDNAGNTSEATVSFTIDKTAPVIAVEGVEDGKDYATDIQPKVTTNEGTLSLTLDGKNYDGSVIKEEGTHILQALAVDNAGNSSVVTKTFTIDKTAPVITIQGIENGKCYTKDLQPEISTNEGKLSLTLDGKIYDGSAISTEGKHTLKAVAVDKAGNSSEVTVTFTIDKTAPIITVKGVENGRYYLLAVQPKVKTNEGTLTMTMDGKNYNGNLIKVQGKHTLKAVAVDNAGNKTEVIVTFTIINPFTWWFRI